MMHLLWNARASSAAAEVSGLRSDKRKIKANGCGGGDGDNDVMLLKMVILNNDEIDKNNDYYHFNDIR